jgi:hypothetical protein
MERSVLLGAESEIKILHQVPEPATISVADTSRHLAARRSRYCRRLERQAVQGTGSLVAPRLSDMRGRRGQRPLVSAASVRDHFTAPGDHGEDGDMAKSETRDGVALTNLDEPLFDGAEATKRNLVDYLDALHAQVIGVLCNRPLSVIRVLRGQAPFMQKNVPKYTPDWVPTTPVWSATSKREIAYALCNDRRTLLWFANQRAIEFHPNLFRIPEVDAPTHLVLDLDPPEGGRLRFGRRGGGIGWHSAVRGWPCRSRQNQRVRGRACLRSGGWGDHRGSRAGNAVARGAGRGPRSLYRDDRVHQG